jgi:hypothetical protein
MAIRPSSSAEIRQLIAALGGEDEVAREAAVARLAVLGERAVEHLLTEFPNATPRARTGMLRAFEAAADPRTFAVARAALQDASATMQIAAIGTIRTFLASSRPALSRDALDALIDTALDQRRVSIVRIAAYEVLRDLPADAHDPIRDTLAADPDPDVRAHTAVRRPQNDDAAWRSRPYDPPRSSPICSGWWITCARTSSVKPIARAAKNGARSAVPFIRRSPPGTAGLRSTTSATVCSTPIGCR